MCADLREMEAEVAARSAMDWSVVRPPRPPDEPLTGTYRTTVGGFRPRGGSSGGGLGRADVAHAMPAMVDDPATLRQGVGRGLL
ncbi:NAD(P)H-binding protein [Streptomyces sp. UG1]|uniref:NAD(P)H-binding protein n=1 Tax=Streptomyces sp. UG1 TaxID=3417652 RepID=UPI003CEB0031